jgi:PAS domain S-box-containing protein
MNYDDQPGLARALFEESADALLLLDPETDQLLDANATAQRLIGIPLRELLRMPLDQVLRFGGPGGLRRVREAAHKTSTFHAQDGYYLCTDRPETYVPVHLSISRLHLQRRTLVLITARDVRDQHAAQARLRQAEEELRRTLAAVPDCVWTAEVDAAGKLAYRSVSPAVERLVGQPAEWFLGGVHRWWSLIDPEDQPRWERALIRLRSGQPTREEYRVTGADGRPHWVRETVQVNPGAGRTLRLDGVISDVTERRQAEERGEQQLRAFLDGTPGPAFLKDGGGRLVHANPAFASLCGKAPAEVVGRTEAEVLPGELARAWPRGDGTAARAVLDVRTPDGTSRRWLVLRFPVRAPEGPPLQAGLVVDLSGY